MSETLRPDICIIGAGPGGLALAMGAAAFGVPTVLIEKGEMGGTHLNAGSVAARTLATTAQAAHVMRHADKLGLAASEPRFDYAHVQARLQSAIAAIAPSVSAARLQAMNLRVIRSAAHFISRKTVEAGDVRVEARRFVIATGAAPVLPHIAGLEYVRALTSETIFELTELPARLLVIGTSVHGLELAQAYQRLGSEVTVIAESALLPDLDTELRQPLLDALMREGIVLHAPVDTVRIDPDGTGVNASYRHDGRDETCAATHVLIAGPRAPNVHAIGLEQAGVAFDHAGIKVKQNLRTSNWRIHAIGDVIGAGSAQAAQAQASLLLRHLLFRQPVSFAAASVARVIHTDPAVATAGLTETEARAQDAKLRLYRLPLSEADAAHTGLPAPGHVKVVVGADGRILGASIIGPQAHELIAPWQLAATKRLRIEDMAAMPVPAMSLADASRRTALQHFSAKFRSPSVQSLIGLLRKFG